MNERLREQVNKKTTLNEQRASEYANESVLFEWSSEQAFGIAYMISDIHDDLWNGMGWEMSDLNFIL